jgi:chromosome segregation ATPase
LTLARDPTYYAPMENELRALEERIGELATLTRRLRAENVELRQSLLSAQGENKVLRERVESAATRLQSLLEHLPEEAA